MDKAVPYYVHEGELVRAERQVNRILLAAIVTNISLLISNILLVTKRR